MSATSEQTLLDAGLNRDQRRFCKINSDHNVRLLAPAGSGKTYSLLWRCRIISDEYAENRATNVKRRIPEPNFLIVAFTRSAKFELIERIKNMPAFEGLRVKALTLNAWGWQFAKKADTYLLSSDDMRSVVSHDLMPVLEKVPLLADAVTKGQGKAINCRELGYLIDLFKSLGFTHKMTLPQYSKHVRYLESIGLKPILDDAYERLYRLEKIEDDDEDSSYRREVVKEFFKLWKEMILRLHEENKFTFEDQKYWARILLEEKIGRREFPKDGNRFTHIFIDEFQDINPLDLALINALCLYNGCGKAVPITIVGDDDQAIFGWRGTTPKYVLDPDKYFNAKFDTCIFETNYRSPKSIVEISNKFLSYNRTRVKKEIRSVAKGKAYVYVKNDCGKYDTISSTVDLACKLLQEKGCKSVALISRRQVALFPYEVLLSDRGIDYSVAADLDIFEGEAMQSLVEILQDVYQIQNNNYTLASNAVLTICDKIGRFKLQKADRGALERRFRKDKAGTVDQVLKSLSTCDDLGLKNIIPSKAAKVINRMIRSQTVYDLMETIQTQLHGLDRDYLKADTDVHYKNPQFDRLTEISRKYGNDLRKFYQDLADAGRAQKISRDNERSDSEQGYLENEAAPIHLLTATRSKGREFDGVIILDADDTEWPNRQTDDIEEERRLFYVAMSRAKKYLYMVVPYNKLESRFLLEAGLI